MYAQDLIEVLCAMHLSSYMDGAFKERGGIMLVGPPGALKSTFLSALDRQYPDCLTLTDLNAKALAALRERISGGGLRTLVFPEFRKLYERKADTASNLEGALRSMVSEGFRSAAFEPQGVSRIDARAAVIGAITSSFRDQQIERWNESGFSRRFLWPLVTLSQPEILDEAVALWERIDFQVQYVPHAPPFGESIPNRTTEAERRALRMMVKYQPGGSSVQQQTILVKILAVLKWWYERSGDTRSAMETVQRFGQSLGPEGGVIDLVTISPQKRTALRKAEHRDQKHLAATALAAARWSGNGTQPAKKSKRKKRR